MKQGFLPVIPSSFADIYICDEAGFFAVFAIPGHVLPHLLIPIKHFDNLCLGQPASLLSIDCQTSRPSAWPVCHWQTNYWQILLLISTPSGCHTKQTVIDQSANKLEFWPMLAGWALTGEETTFGQCLSRTANRLPNWLTRLSVILWFSQNCKPANPSAGQSTVLSGNQPL